jgi:hypothetical protein
MSPLVALALLFVLADLAVKSAAVMLVAACCGAAGTSVRCLAASRVVAWRARAAHVASPFAGTAGLARHVAAGDSRRSSNNCHNWRSTQAELKPRGRPARATGACGYADRGASGCGE